MKLVQSRIDEEARNGLGQRDLIIRNGQIRRSIIMGTKVRNGRHL